MPQLSTAQNDWRARQYEILREASVALRGQPITLWEISADGAAAAVLGTAPESPSPDLDATLRRWFAPVAPGRRWVGSHLAGERWCLAPVRTTPPQPPPGGNERRSAERMVLELAGLSLGLLEQSWLPAPGPSPYPTRDTAPEHAARGDRGFRVLAGILDDGTRSEVRDILYDTVTELPSLAFLLTQVRATLEARHEVGLLTLIVNPSVRLEELFGWVTYDEVLRAVAAALRDIKAEALRRDDVIAELSMSGNSFVFLLSPPRHQAVLLRDDLTKLRQRIAQQLRDRLARDFPPAVVAKFTSSVGCCVLTHQPDVPVQRLVLRALDQAYAEAFRERDAELAARLTRLDDLIARRDLITHYQPIVDLRNQGVLGYEALSRGPPGELQEPSLLFKLAYEADAVWKLDRACRELALAGAQRLPQGALLFLNTDPDSVFDPELHRSAALRAYAGRVVLEITERAAIRDFALFRRALGVIRDLGLRLAIDDVGSAYSGLRLLVETRPDFVKLDMAITENLPDSVAQQEIVRTVARVAEGLHAPLIVEGVERQEQLDVLAALDIRYAQGYLFGAPQPQFQTPSVLSVPR